MLGEAAKSPVLRGVRPNGIEDAPQYQLDIDREKARALGVAVSDINSTLATAWGSSYVNDFIDRGRVKKVFAQGEASSRMLPEDLNKWYVRNNAGDMVPFSAFAKHLELRPAEAEPLQRRAVLQHPGPGGAGLQLGRGDGGNGTAGSQLPVGVGFEWTGLSFEERLSGAQRRRCTPSR